MNLGLYVCSFHFQTTQKQGTSYILNLNGPIKGEEQNYNDILDFFETFFQQYQDAQNIDNDQRIYRIERHNEWRGEDEDIAYIMVKVHSGIYGAEADIYDKKSRKTVGKRGADQADVMPFLWFIAVPKDSSVAKGKSVNKGIMLFQSLGVYGIKSITTQLLSQYAKEEIHASINTYIVSPKAYLDKIFEIGHLKKVRLIRNVRRDPADELSGLCYGKEERIVSNFLAFPDGLIRRLKTFGLKKDDCFEWDDGSQYDNVKVDIDLAPGVSRTINLHNFENRIALNVVFPQKVSGSPVSSIGPGSSPPDRYPSCCFTE